MPPPRRPRLAAAAALLTSLALGACAGTEAEPRLRAGGPEALAERLPAEAGGLRRGAVAPLDGGGREVSYASAGRAAAGIVELLPRAEGASHARWVAQAADGGGPHRRLRETASFREGPLQCSEMEGSYGRHQPVRSLLCSGDAGETSVRLRVSMPRRDPPPADARAFARGVAQALR